MILLRTICLSLALSGLTASPAAAMHIAEGLLPLSWAGLWIALTLPFVALGLRQLRRMSEQDISLRPLAGLMAAVVFIISAMPIPVITAGTCSHPSGTAISAILLGPLVSVVVASVALLIQALFMAHGGLSTLGANIFSMGVIGSFAGYGVFRLLRSAGARIGVAGFMAGIAADWATYLTTSVELASGIRGDEPFMPLLARLILAFVPTQLPIGVLEGAITAGMVSLLARRRPDILVKLGILKPEEVAG